MGNVYVGHTVKKPLNDEQAKFLHDRAVLAQQMIMELQRYMGPAGLEVIQLSVAVSVPDSDQRVLVVANPDLKPDALKELLESFGQNADAVVSQARSVVNSAIMHAAENENCEDCPLRDSCPNTVFCGDKEYHGETIQ